MSKTIYIFNLIGGLSDIIKDLQTICDFTQKYDLLFSIATCVNRPVNDPTLFKSHDANNLFDLTEMFQNVKNYVFYDTIKNNVMKINTHDLNIKYKKLLWTNDANKKLILNSLLETLKFSHEYVLVTSSIWWWYNVNVNYKGFRIDNTFTLKYGTDNIYIKPSQKIVNRFKMFKERIGDLQYNFLHYRYEKDWLKHMNKHRLIYVRPTVDNLLENLPYKQKLPIYVATSDIYELYNKKLMNKKLTEYTNIIYKTKEESEGLDYDECGFLDMLISINSAEVYGFKISGFSMNINNFKQTSNYYDELDIFNKPENYYKE